MYVMPIKIYLLYYNCRCVCNLWGSLFVILQSVYWEPKSKQAMFSYINFCSCNGWVSVNRWISWRRGYNKRHNLNVSKFTLICVHRCERFCSLSLLLLMHDFIMKLLRSCDLYDVLVCRKLLERICVRCIFYIVGHMYLIKTWYFSEIFCMFHIIKF